MEKRDYYEVLEVEKTATVEELKKAYPNLNWQKGRLMNGATKEEIKQWTKK